MAGRKQHFIPRHFLKAFVAPDRKNTLWLFRRGLAAPVPVSRNDAAAANDFYSKPTQADSPTLDGLITEYENKLKFRVEEARATPIGTALPAALISEITVHLAVRAAYPREFMELGVSELITSIEKFVHNPQEILEGIKLPKHRVPLKLEEILMRELEKRSINQHTNLSHKGISRLLYQAIREDFDNFHQSILSFFNVFLSQFQSKFGVLARESHNQALENEIVPEKRQAYLENFKWKIIEVPNGDAILPDCVALAKDKTGWGSYIMADCNSMSCVVLPLSPRKLAVGSIANDHDNLANVYNEIARDSCFTFYLASNKEHEPIEHLHALGGPTRNRITNIVSTAMQEAFEALVEKPPIEKHSGPPQISWADLSSETGFSYSLCLRDFGDGSYANALAEVINCIVKSFMQYLPIHRLDGFTFAINYADALQQVDRGEGVARYSGSLTGISPHNIGTPLLVRRDDGIKTHVVLRSELAEKLVAKDEMLNNDAISVICGCLGVVALNTLIEGKFPGTLLSSLSDPYESWLFRYNDALLATYFSHRFVIHEKDKVEFYAELASKQLKKVLLMAKRARAEYLIDNDHEKFFNYCAEHVSKFMFALARYFGSRGPEYDLHSSEEELNKSLSKFGLIKWSKIFEIDLSDFIENLNNWVSFEEIFFRGLSPWVRDRIMW